MKVFYLQRVGLWDYLQKYENDTLTFTENSLWAMEFPDVESAKRMRDYLKEAFSIHCHIVLDWID